MARSSSRRRALRSMGVTPPSDWSNIIMGDAIHRIDIECIGCNAKGLVWRVTKHGKIIIEKTRIPAFDACRLLLALGNTGKLEMYCDGQHRLSVDIVKGAGLTVVDGVTRGPVIEPYKTFQCKEPDQDEILVMAVIG